jgi:hypothetical protein
MGLVIYLLLPLLRRIATRHICWLLLLLGLEAGLPGLTGTLISGHIRVVGHSRCNRGQGVYKEV